MNGLVGISREGCGPNKILRYAFALYVNFISCRITAYGDVSVTKRTAWSHARK